MIDRQTVFEIHRLGDPGLSIQKISRKLRLDWKTVKKYIKNPCPEKSYDQRGSKLDLFKDEIAGLLKIEPDVSAVVIKQKNDELGYEGGISILKDYFKTVRKPVEKNAFIRFESPPGRQMQVDWGHFGSLRYGDTNRKLYCLGRFLLHPFDRRIGAKGRIAAHDSVLSYGSRKHHISQSLAKAQGLAAEGF
jgi:transposase